MVECERTMIFSILIICSIFPFLKHVCSSEPYKIYNLESDKVCSLGLNGKIRSNRILTGQDGIIVRETTYFDKLSGAHSFTCHFEIDTGHKGQFPGLFAVVQKLYLRKDPKTGDCIDYIKIRPVDKDVVSEITGLNFHLKKNTYPWKKFCGDLSARRDGSQETPHQSGISVAGFLSESEPIVEVDIFVDKIPTNESLQLEIAFTPFTRCSVTPSAYKECGFGKCIKKQNFNDGIVNCPFLNCPDEDGCDISIIGDDSMPPGLRTKVTLTAVTSIFCSFFLFLGCIWCCRYFELLCWSANTLLGRPNPVELSPMRQPSPSAPLPETSSTKDLPPAYETLFPERCKDFPNIDVKS